MGLEPEPGELPPGYPTEYQREEVLRDGRQVFIRPILPGDAPELAEAIKRLMRIRCAAGSWAGRRR